MPAKDGTGPLGQGPITGRGLGLCGAGLGREFGRGFGRSFGFRARAFAQPLELSKDQEKKVLEAELAEVEAEKTEIQKRLKELK